MKKIDEISFGEAAIIIFSGGHHYMISNLSLHQIDEVRQAFRSGDIDGLPIAVRIRRQIDTLPAQNSSDSRLSNWILLRSIDMEPSIRWLSRSTSPATLVSLVVVFVLIAILNVLHTPWPRHSLDPLLHPTIQSSALVFAALVISILLHEVGHLVAACKASGFVGSVSFFVGRRAGGFCADISSAGKVVGMRRAWIYLAGPITQAIVAGALFLTPFQSLQAAGVISALLVLFNLLPVATTDGARAIASLSSR